MHACAQIRAVIEELTAKQGQTLSKQEVDEILTKLDANQDGTISFDGARPARRARVSHRLTRAVLPQSSRRGGRRTIRSAWRGI